MTKWLLDESLPCQEVDPELFFPESTDEQRRALRFIRPMCAGCPVRLDCVQSALREEAGKDQSHRFGIRGGTTPKERLAMARLGMRGLPELY